MKKIMTSDEFREIRECWLEVKACFDEIERLNAEALGEGTAGFAPDVEQKASVMTVHKAKAAAR